MEHEYDDTEYSDVRNLTHSQAVEQMEQAHARMEELDGKHRLSKADEREALRLAGRFDALNQQVERLERTDALAKAGGSGRYKIESGATGGGDRPVRRDAALRSIDNAVRDNLVSPRAAEGVERLVSTGPAQARSWASRWVTVTGSEAYRSAFAKVLMDAQRGHLEFTAPEAEAWRDGAALRTEQRGMGLTDASGGFLVPWELDPAVIITGDGSNSPMLAISRVIQTVSDTWYGVSSEGVVAEWLAEAEEAADASPALAQPAIPAYKASVFVPFSVELQNDAPTLMAELGRLLTDGATQLLNTAFTTGSGVGEPTGIVTALANTASSVVSGGGSEAIDKGDPVKLQNSLGARWQANSRFMAALPTLNTWRQSETANGALLYPSLQTVPPTLLGRPVHENSCMDSTLDTAATQHNYLAIVGAFDNFVVTLRSGSSLELVDHLFGANRRPTGQRGAWLWTRVGSDSVNDNAFAMLDVQTSA